MFPVFEVYRGLRGFTMVHDGSRGFTGVLGGSQGFTGFTMRTPENPKPREPS
ncbi:hypothetical protein AXF42_Ash018734 [Apostasia shenzhenica]|uniref:Uncharacterized protein n=1 Tax=Apostasia shenzhenica TaxID=1088818 RepID=A0A2H9ZZU1_9ASPA|nr:hypothetical protein AXF42_Ash018734 [Apostasia shenzhenica]